MIILRRVLKPQLIAVFVGVVAVGIIAHRLSVQFDHVIQWIKCHKGVETMEIKVLGSGCANCKKTKAVVAEAIQETARRCQGRSRCTDIPSIMAYGVMSTPAIVIDEKVVSAGKVPAKSQVMTMIRNAQAIRQRRPKGARHMSQQAAAVRPAPAPPDGCRCSTAT